MLGQAISSRAISSRSILSRAIFGQTIAARSQDLLDKFLPPLPFVARPGPDAIGRKPDGAQESAELR